ncbi:MAG: PilZ domain-containing protein [Planctomycetes bacterium]|nr:PilZ domain-containing protein [Planctomycetota bacterium]
MTNFQPGKPERRKSIRYSNAGKMFCYVKLEEAKTVGPIEIHDLSAQGIRLVVDPLIQLPMAGTVQLYARESRTWLAIPFQVVYLLPEPKTGLFLAGCNFNRELRETELKSLLPQKQ